MATTTFESAKVGDKVWSFEFGWGSIVDILQDEDRPITCKFENFNMNIQYSLFGLLSKYSTYQTLFWDEIKIVAPEKPRWKPNKGDTYYCIDSRLSPQHCTFSEFPIAEERVNSGNCFETIEEAKEYAEKIKQLLKNR